MQKKTLLPQSVHKLKRIWILCLISLCIAPLNAQTLYKIEMPNYILQASGTNTETLYIKNKEPDSTRKTKVRMDTCHHNGKYMQL